MVTTRISLEHTNSFLEPVLAKFSPNLSSSPGETGIPEPLDQTNGLQIITLNLQSNPLKSWLVRLFSGSLRATIPKPLQPTYLLTSEAIEYLRTPLGMDNGAIGYVFLLDRACRIRWAGCGFAHDKEQEALLRCVGVLLERSKVGGD